VNNYDSHPSWRVAGEALASQESIPEMSSHTGASSLSMSRRLKERANLPGKRDKMD